MQRTKRRSEEAATTESRPCTYTQPRLTSSFSQPLSREPNRLLFKQLLLPLRFTFLCETAQTRASAAVSASGCPPPPPAKAAADRSDLAPPPGRQAVPQHSPRLGPRAPLHSGAGRAGPPTAGVRRPWHQMAIPPRWRRAGPSGPGGPTERVAPTPQRCRPRAAQAPAPSSPSAPGCRRGARSGSPAGRPPPPPRPPPAPASPSVPVPAPGRLPPSPAVRRDPDSGGGPAPAPRRPRPGSARASTAPGSGPAGLRLRLRSASTRGRRQPGSCIWGELQPLTGMPKGSAPVRRYHTSLAHCGASAKTEPWKGPSTRQQHPSSTKRRVLRAGYPASSWRGTRHDLFTVRRGNNSPAFSQTLHHHGFHRLPPVCYHHHPKAEVSHRVPYPHLPPILGRSTVSARGC